MKNTGLIAIGILVVAIIAITQSFFMVDERENAIVLQLGEHKQTIYEPGLYFKLPFIQSVHRFDNRVLTSDVDTDEYLTLDKERLLIDHYTRWRIEDPLQFYMSVRDEEGGLNRIQNMVVAELRDVVSSEMILDVISDEREAIMDRVTERTAERMEGFGIGIIDIRMKRVDVPQEVEESVFERMRAERQRVAARHRAEGEERAQEIRAQAEADRERILGEGEARATEVFAEGFAQNAIIVSDEEGNPVSGANILIDGIQLAMTDASGRAMVNLPREGEFTIRAELKEEDPVAEEEVVVKEGEMIGRIDDDEPFRTDRVGELDLRFYGDPQIFFGYQSDPDFFRFTRTLSTYEDFMVPGGTTLIMGTDAKLFEILKDPEK